MKVRHFLVTIPVLLVLGLLLVGCSNNDSADAQSAHESAETYYSELSMNVSEISRNERMEAEVAEYYVTSCLEEYGEGNVMMFDAVTEDEPDVVRHIIMVRKSADSEWTVECEVLDEA